MNTRNFTLSALGLVALAIAAAPIQQAYAQKTANRPLRWEYKVVAIQTESSTQQIMNAEVQKQMNELGRGGWEPVGCYAKGDEYWFKRPKP